MDPSRVLFLANYTSEMHRAINEDGVNVRGYFAWSLMDNFEWEMGYALPGMLMLLSLALPPPSQVALAYGV